MRKKGKDQDRHHPVLRLTALFTASLFLFQTAAWSAPDLPLSFQTVSAPSVSSGPLFARLEIPEAFGTITETFLPGDSENESAIIHIQDAHAHPQAQRHIEALLGELARTQAIRAIAVEGAFGRIETSALRLFDTPSLNEAMGEYLVDIGELTGAELFGLKQQGQEIPILGVEEGDLYQKSYEIFRNVKRSDVKKKHFFDSYRKLFQRLAETELSEDLRSLLETRAQWEERADETQKYLGVLQRLARDHLDLDLSNPIRQFEWPSLSRLMRARELEKEFRPELAAKESGELVLALRKARGIDSGTADFLIAVIEAFMDPGQDAERVLQKENFPGVQTHREFFEKLYAVTSKEGLSLAAFPAFLDCGALAILKEETEASELMKEMDLLEEDLVTVLTKTERERELVRIMDDFSLLQKLVELAMTRDDYETYLARKKDLSREAVMKRLGNYDVPRQLPYIPSDFLAAAESFYRLSRQRDESLIANTLKALPADGRKGAVVLIAGGFHSRGLTELMKEKKMPHVVIMPRMTDLGPKGLYEKVMLGKNSNLDELLANPAALVKLLLTQAADFYQAHGVNPSEQPLLIVRALKDVAIPAMRENGASAIEIHAALEGIVSGNPLLSGVQVLPYDTGGQVVLRIDAAGEVIDIPVLGGEAQAQPSEPVSPQTGDLETSLMGQLRSTVARLKGLSLPPASALEAGMALAKLGQPALRSELRVQVDPQVRDILNAIPHRDERFGRVVAAIEDVIRIKAAELQQATPAERAQGRKPLREPIAESLEPPSYFRPVIEDLAWSVYERRRLGELPLAYRVAYALSVFDGNNFPRVHARLVDISRSIRLGEHVQSDQIRAREFAAIIRAYNEAEHQETIEENMMLRFALDKLIFNMPRAERRALEKEAVVDELIKELDAEGTGNVPQIVFITDLHGSTKVGSLIAYALGVKNYQNIFSVAQLEKRLQEEGIDIAEKNILFVGGSDYVDRGPKPYWGFQFNRWLRSKGKLKFINGNHDIWKDWNILGAHLRVHDAFRAIAASGQFEARHTALHVSQLRPFVTTVGWDPEKDSEKFDRLNEQLSAQVEEFVTLAASRPVSDEMVELFANRIIDAGPEPGNPVSGTNPNHSLEWWAREWGIHGGWFDTFLDQLNEEMLNEVIGAANEHLQGESALVAQLAARLQDSQSISGVLASHREEILENLKQNGILFSPVEASRFVTDEVRRLRQEIKEVKDRNKAVREANEALAKQGRYSEMQSQEPVPSSFELTARAAQKILLDLSLQISSLNSLVPGLSLPQPDVTLVTQSNYRQNPKVVETVLWDWKSFRLFYTDVWGNAFNHGIIPVDRKRLDFKVDYVTQSGRRLHGVAAIERIQYDIRRFFEGRDEIPDTPEFRATVEREVGNAFRVLNDWYSDVLASLKPPAIQEFVTSGGPRAYPFGTASALSPREFDGNKGVIMVGHVESSKLHKQNLPYWIGGMEGGLLHGDFEMSEGYSGRGAILSWFGRFGGKLTGVRRYGFKETVPSLRKALADARKADKPDEAAIRLLEERLQFAESQGESILDITIYDDLPETEHDVIGPYMSGEGLAAYYSERFLEENAETYGRLSREAPFYGRPDRAARHETKALEAREALEALRSKLAARALRLLEGMDVRGIENVSALIQEGKYLDARRAVQELLPGLLPQGNRWSYSNPEVIRRLNRVVSVLPRTMTESQANEIAEITVAPVSRGVSAATPALLNLPESRPGAQVGIQVKRPERLPQILEALEVLTGRPTQAINRITSNSLEILPAEFTSMSITEGSQLTVEYAAARSELREAEQLKSRALEVLTETRRDLPTARAIDPSLQDAMTHLSAGRYEPAAAAVRRVIETLSGFPYSLTPKSGFLSALSDAETLILQADALVSGENRSELRGVQRLMERGFREDVAEALSRQALDAGTTADLERTYPLTYSNLLEHSRVLRDINSAFLFANIFAVTFVGGLFLFGITNWIAAGLAVILPAVWLLHIDTMVQRDGALDLGDAILVPNKLTSGLQVTSDRILEILEDAESRAERIQMLGDSTAGVYAASEFIRGHARLLSRPAEELAGALSAAVRVSAQPQAALKAYQGQIVLIRNALRLTTEESRLPENEQVAIVNSRIPMAAQLDHLIRAFSLARSEIRKQRVSEAIPSPLRTEAILQKLARIDRRLDANNFYASTGDGPRGTEEQLFRSFIAPVTPGKIRSFFRTEAAREYFEKNLDGVLLVLDRLITDSGYRSARQWAEFDASQLPRLAGESLAEQDRLNRLEGSSLSARETVAHEKFKNVWESAHATVVFDTEDWNLTAAGDEASFKLSKQFAVDLGDALIREGLTAEEAAQELARLLSDADRTAWDEVNEGRWVTYGSDSIYMVEGKTHTFADPAALSRLLQKYPDYSLSTELSRDRAVRSGANLRSRDITPNEKRNLTSQMWLEERGIPARYGAPGEGLPSGATPRANIPGFFGNSAVLYVAPTKNMERRLSALSSRLRETKAFRAGKIKIYPSYSLHYTLGNFTKHQALPVGSHDVGWNQLETRAIAENSPSFDALWQGLTVDENGFIVLQGFFGEGFRELEEGFVDAQLRGRHYPRVDFNFAVITAALDEAELSELQAFLNAHAEFYVGSRHVESIHFVHHQDDMLKNPFYVAEMPLAAGRSELRTLAAEPHFVPTNPLDKSLFVAVTGRERVLDLGLRVREFEAQVPGSLKQNAEGKPWVLHINTSIVGGVGDILTSLVSLSEDEDVNLRSRWFLMQGDSPFYAFTKTKMHNVFHGGGEEATAADKAHFEAIADENSAVLLKQTADQKMGPPAVVILHDQQPLAMIRSLQEAWPETKFVWRGHIPYIVSEDRESISNKLWTWLTDSYISRTDAAVFHIEEYNPGFGLDEDEKVFYVLPSINPIGLINRQYSPQFIQATLAKYGIDADFSDASARPFALQNSRFDLYKDQLGVLQAYEKSVFDLIRRNAPLRNIPRLILVGPNAPDDPEGGQVYQSLLDYIASNRVEDRIREALGQKYGAEAAGQKNIFVTPLDPAHTRFDDQQRLNLADLKQAVWRERQRLNVPTTDSPENIDLDAELSPELQHEVEIAAFLGAVRLTHGVTFIKSTREGFALAATSKGFHQTARIVSNVGGLPHQIVDGQTGILVGLDGNGKFEREISVAQASENLTALMIDESRRIEMARAAREHVVNNFLPDRHLGDWLNIFSSLFPSRAVSVRSELRDSIDITVFDGAADMARRAAEDLLQTVRQYPDAVIILPTGSTPVPMYNAIIERFEKDKTIDFSRVRFFNLDEYIGLEEGHPLSYRFYMDTNFYNRLDAIDPTRAPPAHGRNVPYVTQGESPQEAANRYESELQAAIQATGRGKADLAVLGIGGAYPVKDEAGTLIGMKGGHIGFNEPGSSADDRTQVMRLTDKTRKDTGFRFSNVRFHQNFSGQWTTEVPARALTLGVANILESTRVILMANGEEKSKVIEEAYLREPNPDFPATFLKTHPSVSWYLDRDAASRLPHTQTPWTIYEDFEWNQKALRQAVLEILRRNPSRTLAVLTETDLTGIGVPEDVITEAGGIEAVRTDMRSFLEGHIAMGAQEDILPRNQRVVLFSPHPDDDVITSAITLKRLVERGNEVHVVYQVGGENAVRNSDAQHAFDALRKQRLGVPDSEIWKEAKRQVRRQEASRAAAVVGVRNTHFLELPYYYTRGFVDQPPLSEAGDVRPVLDLLNQIQPEYIFYSAEQDPHGAHGLGAKVIQRALSHQDSKVSRDAAILGYMGAYEEWPLEEESNLIIVPFSERIWNTKELAIKEHRSQLNPEFPSFDEREFFERARDRNGSVGDLLKQMGYLTEHGKQYAEVFKTFTVQEFTGRSELRSRNWIAEQGLKRLQNHTVVSRQMEAGLPPTLLAELAEKYGEEIADLVAASTVTGGLGALMPDLFESWAANGVDIIGINPIYEEIKNVPRYRGGLGHFLRETLEDTGIRFTVDLTITDAFRSAAYARGSRAQSILDKQIHVRIFKTYASVHHSPQYYLDAYTLQDPSQPDSPGNRVRLFDEVYPDDYLWRDIHMAVFNKASQELTQRLQQEGAVQDHVFFVDNEVFVSLPTSAKSDNPVFQDLAPSLEAIRDYIEKQYGAEAAQALLDETRAGTLGELTPIAFLWALEWLQHHINHTVYRPGIYPPDAVSYELFDLPESLRPLIVDSGKIKLIDYVARVYNMITGVGLIEHTPRLHEEIFPTEGHKLRGHNQEGVRSTNGVFLPRWQSNERQNLIRHTKTELGLDVTVDDKVLYDTLRQKGNERALQEFQVRNETVKAAEVARFLIWFRHKQGKTGAADWLASTMRQYAHASGDPEGDLRTFIVRVSEAASTGDSGLWSSLEAGNHRELVDVLLSDPISSNVRRQVPYKGPDKWREMIDFLGHPGAADAPRWASVLETLREYANELDDPEDDLRQFFAAVTQAAESGAPDLWSALNSATRQEFVDLLLSDTTASNMLETLRRDAHALDEPEDDFRQFITAVTQAAKSGAPDLWSALNDGTRRELVDLLLSDTAASNVLKTLRENRNAFRYFKKQAGRYILGGRIFSQNDLHAFNEIKRLIVELGLEDRIQTVENYNIREANIIFESMSGVIMIADEWLEASATSMMKGATNGAEIIGVFGGANPEIWEIVETATGRMIDVFNENGQPVTHDQLVAKIAAGEWEITNGRLVEYLPYGVGPGLDKSDLPGGYRRPSAESMMQAFVAHATDHRNPETRRKRLFNTVAASHRVDMEVSQARGHAFLWEGMLEQAFEQTRILTNNVFSLDDAESLFGDDVEGFDLRTGDGQVVQTNERGPAGLVQGMQLLRARGSDATRGLQAAASLLHHANSNSELGGELLPYLLRVLPEAAGNLAPLRAEINRLRALSVDADAEGRVALNLEALDLVDKFLILYAGAFFRRYIQENDPQKIAVYEKLLTHRALRNYVNRFLEMHPAVTSLHSDDKGIRVYRVPVEGVHYLAALNLNAISYPDPDGGSVNKAWTRVQFDGELKTFVGADATPESLTMYQAQDVKAKENFNLYTVSGLERGLKVGVPDSKKVQILRLIARQTRAIPYLSAAFGRTDFRVRGPVGAFIQRIRGAMDAGESPSAVLSEVAGLTTSSAHHLFGTENIPAVMALIAGLAPDLLRQTRPWHYDAYRRLAPIVKEHENLLADGKVNFHTSSRPEGTLAFSRELGGANIVFLIQFTSDPISYQDGRIGKVWSVISDLGDAAQALPDGAVPGLGLDAAASYAVQDLAADPKGTVAYRPQSGRELLEKGWAVGIPVRSLQTNQSLDRFQILRLKQVNRSELRVGERGRLEDISRAYVSELAAEDYEAQSADAFLVLGIPDFQTYTGFAKRWHEIKDRTGRSVPVVLAGGRGRGTIPLIEKTVQHYWNRLPQERSRLLRFLSDPSITEADVMHFILTEEGIPAGMIHRESAPSRNTAQNFENTKEVVTTLVEGAEKPVIGLVTSPTLLRRLLPTARNNWTDTAQQGWRLARLAAYRANLSLLSDNELVERLGYIAGFPAAYVERYPGINPHNELKGVYDQEEIPEESRDFSRVRRIHEAFGPYLDTLTLHPDERTGRLLTTEALESQQAIYSLVPPSKEDVTAGIELLLANPVIAADTRAAVALNTALSFVNHDEVIPYELGSRLRTDVAALRDPAVAAVRAESGEEEAAKQELNDRTASLHKAFDIVERFALHRSEIRVPQVVFSKFSQNPDFNDMDREFYAFLPPRGKVSVTLKIGGTTLAAKKLSSAGNFPLVTEPVASFDRGPGESLLDVIQRRATESGGSEDEVFLELQNQTLERMADQIADLLTRGRGIEIDKLHQIGISSPGPFVGGGVDGSGTFAVTAFNLPFSQGLSLRTELFNRVSNRVNLPGLTPEHFVVMHDGAAGGAGELSRVGSTPGVNNLFYLIWGTGIGASLWVDGRLFTGGETVHNLLGEVGHHHVWFPETQAYEWVGRWTKGTPHHLSGEYFAGYQDVEDRLRGPALAARFGKEDAGKLSHEEALEAGYELGRAIGVFTKNIAAEYGEHTLPEQVVIGSGVSHLGVTYPDLIAEINRGVQDEVHRPLEQTLGYRHALTSKRAEEIAGVALQEMSEWDRLTASRAYLAERYGSVYADNYLRGLLVSPAAHRENLYRFERQEDLRDTIVRHIRRTGTLPHDLPFLGETIQALTDYDLQSALENLDRAIEANESARVEQSRITDLVTFRREVMRLNDLLAETGRSELRVTLRKDIPFDVRPGFSILLIQADPVSAVLRVTARSRRILTASEFDRQLASLGTDQSLTEGADETRVLTLIKTGLPSEEGLQEIVVASTTNEAEKYVIRLTDSSFDGREAELEILEPLIDTAERSELRTDEQAGKPTVEYFETLYDTALRDYIAWQRLSALPVANVPREDLFAAREQFIQSSGLIRTEIARLIEAGKTDLLVDVYKAMQTLDEKSGQEKYGRDGFNRWTFYEDDLRWALSDVGIPVTNLRSRQRSELRLDNFSGIRNDFEVSRSVLGDYATRRWVTLHVAEGFFAMISSDLPAETREALERFLAFDLLHFSPVNAVRVPFGDASLQPAVRDTAVLAEKGLQLSFHSSVPAELEDYFYALARVLDEQPGLYLRELIEGITSGEAETLNRLFSETYRYASFGNRIRFEAVTNQNRFAVIQNAVNTTFQQVQGEVPFATPYEFAQNRVTVASTSESLLADLVSPAAWRINNNVPDNPGPQYLLSSRAVELTFGVHERIRELGEEQALRSFVSALSVMGVSVDVATRLWEDHFRNRFFHRMA